MGYITSGRFKYSRHHLPQLRRLVSLASNYILPQTKLIVTISAYATPENNIKFYLSKNFLIHSLSMIIAKQYPPTS